MKKRSQALASRIFQRYDGHWHFIIGDSGKLHNSRESPSYSNNETIIGIL